MKKWIPVVVAVLVAGGISFGGAIKVWSSGDFLQSADLNANFAHIHSTMVGGHGPRLVDSDVSASANIQLTKIATNGQLVRSTGVITGNAGVITAPSGSTLWLATGGWTPDAVKYGAVGQYIVTFPTKPRTNGSWYGLAQPVGGQNGGTPTPPNAAVNCVTYFPSDAGLNTALGVNCYNSFDGGSIDTSVAVQIFDSLTP